MITPLSLATSVAVLTPSFAAPVPGPPAQGSSSRSFLQGAVLPIGWPEGREPGVVGLHALRFSSALELDAVLHVGEEAVLVHHPARYEAFYSLAKGVRALAVLPLATGLDGVLVVDGRGLVSKVWDPVAPSTSGGFLRERVVAGDWTGVDALWLAEEDGKQLVLGRDPGGASGPELLALEYDPASDLPGGDPWTALAPTALPAPLVDHVFLEYDDGQPGEERAWLFDGSLVVTDASGTVLLASAAAAGEDRLGRLASGPFSYGSGTLYAEPELGLWTTKLAGQPTLVAANGSALGGPAPYALPAEVGAIAVLDLEGDGAEEVVLAERAEAFATLLWRDPSSPWNDFCSPPGASPFGTADTIDTLESSHELPLRPAIEAVAAGDFDLDGDPDLLVAHAGTAELRLWLSSFPFGTNERTRLFCDEEELAVESLPTGEVRVEAAFERNAGAGFAYWHAEVWLDPSHGDPRDAPSRIEDCILSDEDSTVELSFVYDPAAPGLSPDHVCWIVLTGIDYDPENDTILERHATRVIYSSPDEGVEAELEGAYYPEVEHLFDDGGESSGLRRGTRAGAGTPMPPPQ